MLSHYCRLSIFLTCVFKSTEAYIPTEFFYMDTVDYFELQRIGGLKSYLFNEHKGTAIFTIFFKQSFIIQLFK